MPTDSDTEDNSSTFTRTTAPTEWMTDSQEEDNFWADDDDNFSIGSLYVRLDTPLALRLPMTWLVSDISAQWRRINPVHNIKYLELSLRGTFTIGQASNGKGFASSLSHATPIH